MGHDAEPRTRSAGDEAHGLLVLDDVAIRSIFTPELARRSQEDAFAERGRDDVTEHPPRIHMDLENGTIFCLLAAAGPTLPAVCKVGGFAPGNHALGLPSVGAVVTVLDAATGLPVAILDGTSLTELRTSAASAFAATVLAPESDTIAVIGTGVQGVAAIRALSASHPGATATVWDPDPSRVDLALSQLGPDAMPSKAAPTAQEAVAGASLIVLCTNATEPVIKSEWVADGATVISIGSIAQDRHEVDQALVKRADRVIVDDRREAITNIGPVHAAIADGIIEDEPLTELSDIVAGRKPGRDGGTELLLYFSIGIAVQDAAAAKAVCDAAIKQSVGSRLSLSHPAGKK